MQNYFGPQKSQQSLFHLKNTSKKHKRKLNEHPIVSRDAFRSLQSDSSSRSIRIHQIPKRDNFKFIELGHLKSSKSFTGIKEQSVKSSSKLKISQINEIDSGLLARKGNSNISLNKSKFGNKQLLVQESNDRIKTKQNGHYGQDLKISTKYLKKQSKYKTISSKEELNKERQSSSFKYFRETKIKEDRKIDRLTRERENIGKFMLDLQKQMKQNGFKLEIDEKMVEQGLKNRRYRQKMHLAGNRIIYRLLRKKILKEYNHFVLVLKKQN